MTVRGRLDAWAKSEVVNRVGNAVVLGVITVQIARSVTSGRSEGPDQFLGRVILGSLGVWTLVLCLLQWRWLRRRVELVRRILQVALSLGLIVVGMATDDFEVGGRMLWALVG